jgi:hypothetical protein
MKTRTATKLTGFGLAGLLVAGMLAFIPQRAQADNFGISFGYSDNNYRGESLRYSGYYNTGFGYHHSPSYIRVRDRYPRRPSVRYYQRPTYNRHRGLYPRYGYNPVVRRDVDYDRHYSWDGTKHTERYVEDKHRSYYSPGREHAITPPKTRVYRERGRDYEVEKERTTWIGADGRPHGSEVEKITTVDPWGDSHTDTHVRLWKNDGEQPDHNKEGKVSESTKKSGKDNNRGLNTNKVDRDK